MTKEEAFQFLDTLAKGIATMFGNQCETVVQELEDDVFSTVSIYNGQVSGREVNSKLGILGGTLKSENIDLEQVRKGVFNQLVKHPSGKLIKSSSFTLIGEDYFYILGINYDATQLDQMGQFIENFMKNDGDLFSTLNQETEYSMENILEACVKMTGVEGRKLKKKERLALIRLLEEHHFFQIQKSVPYLSEQIGVSKYTIYKDLNELEKEK